MSPGRSGEPPNRRGFFAGHSSFNDLQQNKIDKEPKSSSKGTNAMETRIMFRLIGPMILLACPVGVSAQKTEDEALIRGATAAYVEAFNRHDAAAVAAKWAPDAVYENPITGEVVEGRGEIQEQLKSIFAENSDLKLDVEIKEIRFLAPQVAFEEGIARVLVPNQEPDETTYTAVHVKTDGKWLIGRMSEQPRSQTPSNYGRLKELEWMVGTWLDHDDDAVIETTCHWTKNQNFLMRAFKVTVGDQIDLSGMQLIGWDPAANRIRSWAFDSDGGFARGTWEKRGDSWVNSSTATLPDGRRSTAVNTLSVVDDSTFTWQSTGRELDGEILPNIDPISIRRKNNTE